MSDQFEHLEDEISDLKRELESFQHEKERVRAILGKVGGIPTFNEKVINAVFVIVIVASVAISIIGGEKWRLLMIEFATVALSLKIIYLIHCQMRISHFEFWILSSIEWRINEMMTHVRQMKKEKD